MRRTLTGAAAALLVAAGCGTQTTPPDEDRLDEIRLMLETTTCTRRMDDLSYELVQAWLATPDSLRTGIPAGIPDSLYRCPATGLAYTVELDELHLLVECPSGHGSVDLDL